MTIHVPDPVSRPETRWTRRKDARPAELLSAALDLFVERGYAATRLDDVARRAGVSKGTLYLYFESKEELFKAVIRGGLVPAIQRNERVVEDHTGTMAALLETIVDNWWQDIGNSRLGGIPKLMFAEARNFPELAQFYHREVISRGYKLVGEVLEQGQRRGEFPVMDIGHASRIVMAPLVFLLLWRHSFDGCDGTRIDPDAYLRLHLRIVLDGLRSRPHAEPSTAVRSAVDTAPACR